MKQNTILKVIRIVLVLAAIVAAICAVTVTGSGFLDLRNLVRAVCAGVAVVCGILAFVVWNSSKPEG